MTNLFIKAFLVIFVLSCVFYECTCVVGSGKLKPLPTRTNYSASDAEYDDGGMGPLYNFARNFINTALPGDFPTDFINDTMRSYDSGQFGVDNLKAMLDRFKGYIAAIAVGILFIILFPIVGMFFCCCRLCGNCGGSRKQKVTGGMHMKRRVFAAILFGLTTFTLVGNICTYVSNGRMTVALDKIGDTVENNLDDIDSFLDLVVEQVKTIGIDNLETTKTGILNYLDQTQLEHEISTYVLDSLSGGSLTKMQNQITETGKAFDLIIQSRDRVKQYASTLQIPNPVAGSQFTMLDAKKSQFDNFKAFDLTGKVEKEVINKIHGQLGGLSSQKHDVDTAFGKIKTKVDKAVTQIQDFRQKADDGLDLESYKQKARSYTDTMKTYDKYRYAAAAGLAGITTLVVTLQFLGLAFGSIGQGWSTEPSQRGCVSSAGGNFLMASVGFIFLFSSLLMLLTTICFSLGAILERFVCQPLSDDGLQLLKVADPYIPTRSTLNADLSDVLKDCREGKSAYTAFRLQSKINLTTLDQTLDDQKQSIDHTLQLVLNKVSTIGSVSFGGVPIATQLSALQASMAGMDFDAMKTQLQGVLGTLPATLAPIRAAMQDMLSAIGALEKASRNIGGLSNDFQTGMATASSQIGSKMQNLMGDFKKRVINIAELYVNTTKRDIKENMGRCSPVWNLYESILVVAVCKYTVDSFNGFWFSIGWCLFFFVPSAIFSVKLAKHYKRMNAEKGSTLDRESSFGYDSPVHRRNKVGHMDDQPISGY